MNNGINHFRNSSNVNQTTAQSQHETAPRRGIRAPQISQPMQQSLRNQQSAHVPNTSNSSALGDDLMLIDLRLNANETNQDLLMIPHVGTQFNVNDYLPSHPETDALHGFDLFNALALDQQGTLPPQFQQVCTREVLFGRNRNFDRNPPPQHQVDDYENKLRFIANRLRVTHSEHFREQVEMLSNEAAIHCQDRTAYFINQLFENACVDALMATEGRQNLAAIFNLGVGFYKQARLRAVVTDILTQYSSLPVVRHLAPEWANRAFSRAESVETLLFVEHQLQDVLGLPIKQPKPEFGAYSVLKAGQDLNKVLELVQADLVENDGERLFDYLSTWEPWVKVFREHFLVRDEIDQLLEQSVERDQTVRSEQNLDEQTILEMCDLYKAQYHSTKADIIGQATKSFLMNIRTQIFERVNGHYPENFNL